MKRLYVLMFTFVLALMLGACGDKNDKDQAVDQDKTEQTEKSEKKEEPKDVEKNQEIEISDKEKVPNDKVVVQVNDHDVKGQHYNSIYMQTKMRLHQFGEDIKDLDAIKEQTMDELIAQELFRQEAEAKGIEVTDEEVQSEFDGLKKEAEDQLQAYLDQFHLTETSMKELIYYKILFDKYVQQEINVPEVSEAEAKELYDELKKENKELPKYDELQSNIKEQLVLKKQQEQLQERLAELKKEAEIEKKI